jgi:hypothetical protein
MALDYVVRIMRNTVISLLLLSTVLVGACSSLPFNAPAAPLPRPEVANFKADKTNIESGASTTLRWEVKGADTVTIDGGVGNVSATGDAEVKPSGISAYNLTASNAGGTIVCSVIINVKPFVKVTGTTSTASSATAPHAALQVLPRLGANESYVFYGEAVMVGADEHYVVLRNNPAARNPTWAELKTFLQNDATEKHAYITGKYTCGDFAETLHNNAEAAGIRTGLVAIELQKDGVIINHSLNMFETTDRGLVYIDNTSSSQGYYADRMGDVALGRDYISVSIFPQPGQMQTWPSMGKVIAFDIQQW